MKNLRFILCVSMFMFSCQHDTKTASNIFDFIPENASVVIKTNTLESLKSAVNSNTLCQELLKYNQVKDLNEKLEPLSYLKSNAECIITLAKDANDSLEVSFITNYNPSVFELDSIPNLISESYTSKDKSISKLRINNRQFYSTVKDSVLFLSNRLHLVESSFENQDDNYEIQKLLHIAGKEKSVSVVLNLKNNRFKFNTTTHSEFNNAQISNYLLLDGDLSQNNIALNGITKATDSTQSLINVFKQNIPQENKMAAISPNDSDYFMSLTFSDFKLFEAQLSTFKNSDSIIPESHILTTVDEVGYIERNAKRALVFKSIDASSTKEELSQNMYATFRSVDIYNWDKSNWLSNALTPFLPKVDVTYYAQIGDFFVLVNDIEFLESIISNVQNNTTLSETEHYKDLMLQMSDESSLLMYSNGKHLNAIFDSNFKDSKNLELNTYKASAIQYIYDTDFAHVNTVFSTYKSRSRSHAVSEDLNITLDAAILNEPQLLNNHTNNQKDIAVQDINNNLYLISNQGKIYWKKKIEGRILGAIEQIDMYKNGRLQLAFVTSNKLYVLDRNGKDVAPFPLKFNDTITQPLSVFDYDNKRNYRLLVTQGNSLLMYDQRGKPVNGFKYKSAKNTISTQPKHFRIGRKDYIVFADGSTMEVLNRVGKRRVNVKERIDFSGNDIYLYNNKFTTSNLRGELLEVDQNGNVNHKNLNLSETHAIATTSKTLVTLSENQLRIKTKMIALDFGDYTDPKIFYINDKIYVTVTDLQAKKVYLFDSQTKPIASFPVYGNSSVDMDNIDNDNALELIVKGDDNSIIIYEIN